MTPKVGTVHFPRNRFFIEEMKAVFGLEWEAMHHSWREMILKDLHYLWAKEGGYRGWGTVNAVVVAYKALLESRRA